LIEFLVESTLKDIIIWLFKMADKNDASMQVEGDNNIGSINKFNGMNF
jgi:hypothetical protein